MGPTKHRTLAFAVVAALAALVALPAAAPAAKKPKQQPPQIRSTSIALGETAGTVRLGAEVSRASHVTATIGTGSIRQELRLAPADGNRTTLWTAEHAQGLETCLPVRFVARNAVGHDVHSEDGCVFGLTGPPPSFSFPFIPV